MFETFLRHFPRDRWQHPAADSVTVARLHHHGLQEFFETLGGGSFREGLYRTIHPSELGLWQGRVHLAYPQFEGRVTCFGYDWLGNVLRSTPVAWKAAKRAALEAMLRFGRPKSVQLATLIDRGHRELPIQPDYTGAQVFTEVGDHVTVVCDEKETDGVFLEARTEAGS